MNVLQLTRSTYTNASEHELSSNIEKIMTSIPPEHRSTLICSIIGAQNTGKSTLLNTIFGTQFPVRNQSEIFDPCTRGILMQILDDYIVLDSEGSDRNGDRDYRDCMVIGACLLTISQVIIINITFENLQNGSYRQIFESLLKLYADINTIREIKYVIFVVTKMAGERLIEAHLKRAKEFMKEVSERVSINQSRNFKVESMKLRYIYMIMTVEVI